MYFFCLNVHIFYRIVRSQIVYLFAKQRYPKLFAYVLHDADLVCESKAVRYHSVGSCKKKKKNHQSAAVIAVEHQT